MPGIPGVESASSVNLREWPIIVCLEFAALATGGETYVEARKVTTEKGCPLVVMVGATWCPACQVMKNSVIPEVRRQGILQRVSFAAVDVDQEQELGSQLTKGGPLPQILMLRKTEQGWKLRRLVGGQDAQAVEKFIAQGIEADRKARPAGSSPGWQPPREKLEEPRTASIKASQEADSATTK